MQTAFARTQAVTEWDIQHIGALSDELRSKAMELTDTWGAMFITDEETVTRAGRALGFSDFVCARAFQRVRELEYVAARGDDAPEGGLFTWHALDATFLALRGVPSLSTAMSSVTDETLEDLLVRNHETFQRVMDALPPYARYHMFSPETGAAVMAAFGARVGADTLFDLGLRYGGIATRDLEGRRGISTQFIRSVTLTITASL